VAETLGSLIDYIGNQLQGFYVDQPMYATTDGLVQANALEIKLTLPAQAQPQGLLEIDGELIHVAVVRPGHGYCHGPGVGSRPAGHDAGRARLRLQGSL
jgi:hypothetical protein